MAIVAEGRGGRIYLAPDAEHVRVASSAVPRWKPDEEMNQDTPNLVSGRGYGITHWHELFTSRQLVALTTFSDLVSEARERVRQDAVNAGLPDDGVPLNDGGTGAQAYADAVATYLAEAVSKLTTFHNTLAYWRAKENKSATGFGRQALAMTWDYTEANPFAGAGGDFAEIATKAAPRVLCSALPVRITGTVQQIDAAQSSGGPLHPVVCTDPPYYDNIGYADLSDFFYVWLRRSLKEVYPGLFSTLLVPKAQELIAAPYRFGGDRRKARQFFEDGLGRVFQSIRERMHSDYPAAVYYAFKQTETEGEGKDNNTASTGWETMLEGLVKANLQITGTWPMRTENPGRAMAHGNNALASSIVLVCRPRAEDAPLATRRDFLNAMKQELAPALRLLQKGNIAPVDLAQASIGPGMAIYSRYSRVLEADGSSMRVRTALALINQAMDEYLTEQEGEYDSDTRWALAWFEQFGLKEGPYGDAETLSKAKNTSVAGMVDAGILRAKGGKVRLLGRDELAGDWDPGEDARLTVWEVTHQLIRTMQEDGERAAAGLLARVGGLSECARDLAYRLYTICERRKWAQDALGYNSLVIAWPELVRLAEEVRRETPVQGGLGM